MGAGATTAINAMITPKEITNTTSSAIINVCHDEEVRAELRATLCNVIDADLSEDICSSFTLVGRSLRSVCCYSK